MHKNDWDRFINLTMMIAENYNKPFSPAKQDLWWQLLVEYDIEDIEQAVFKHMQNSSYMPTPADFIKSMEPDFTEIINRCIARTGFKNEIERTTWSVVGYACRTKLSEKDALIKFTKEYKRQVELSKQSKQPMTNRIEQAQPINIKDQMVDDNIDKYKGKSKEEIQQMIANLKRNTKTR